MKSLMREPLLHFVLLGVAIFGVGAWRTWRRGSFELLKQAVFRIRREREEP